MRKKVKAMACLFNVEDQLEKLAHMHDHRFEVLAERKKDQHMIRLICKILAPSEYGANEKWDITFNNFPVFIDLPGFGLCVATRARDGLFQGKRTRHFGVFKYNPFVANDSELREQHFEIPENGQIGDVEMRWVYALPFSMILFRLNQKFHENSEIELIRAKDYNLPEPTIRKMHLKNFLKAVSEDKHKTNGYQVLMEALRLQFPTEVEKYMVLVKEMHTPESSTGPALMEKRIGDCASDMEEVRQTRERQFKERYSRAHLIPGIELFTKDLPAYRSKHFHQHFPTTTDRVIKNLKSVESSDEWQCSLFSFAQD